MSRMSDLDVVIREGGDGPRVERLRRSIAELEGEIAAARAAVYAGRDDEIMARLEAEVMPLQRERRRLRLSLNALLGWYARRAFA